MRKKLTEMTIKDINAEIETNEVKRQEVIKKWKPLDNKLTQLCNKNRKLKEQIEKIEFQAKANKKRTDWNWLLHESNSNSSMDKDHLRKQKLRELGLCSSGYFRDTEQVQISIALIKNDPKSLPTIMKSLKRLLKYVKPMEGYKRIDIFEHTLFAGGCYEMLINEEKGEYKIEKTTYHRHEIRYTFNNLKEALVTIQKKYYYEDANKNDTDEYDTNEYDY